MLWHSADPHRSCSPILINGDSVRPTRPFKAKSVADQELRKEYVVMYLHYRYQRTIHQDAHHDLDKRVQSGYSANASKAAGYGQGFIADRGREVCTATADNKYQKLTGTPASIIRYYLCLEWKMSSSIDKSTTAKRETWRHGDIGGCVTTVACCCQPLNSEQVRA